MNSPQDGGPAFPAYINTPSGLVADALRPGMPLRVWLAAQFAGAELITNSLSESNMKAFAEACTKAGHTVEQHIACNCFDLAEAFIAEESKRKEGA